MYAPRGEWILTELHVRAHGVDWIAKYYYDPIYLENWELDSVVAPDGTNLYDALYFGPDIMQTCESAVNAEMYNRKAGNL